MDQEVQVWREGRAGRIRLHRPQALNALTLGMLRAIHTALDAFCADPDVHFLLIDAPERGFCAGGDVRGIRVAAMAGERSAARTFFASEYELNQAIAECPKPVVALVDGVCMGGGIGIAVHGRHRIATERATFAMPETAIGLFPDVGTSFLLPRLPGALGFYMGLTGARMAGADAVHAGLATHFVRRDSLPALAAALAQDGVAVIASFAEPLPAFSLAAARPSIDAAFSAPSVKEIVARLEADRSTFAEETLRTLRQNSPSAVHWSFAILRAGAHRNLRQALAGELALAVQVTNHPDFFEGVRAVLVDKDRAPKWQPARLEDVDPAAINALFADTPR
jgi:enoyl-CoA hydratase/carnithine racemase